MARIAKSDFIHANKKHIAIGVEGQPIRTFSYKALWDRVRNVNTKSTQLSLGYSNNAKFPIFLGMKGGYGNYTKVLGDIPDLIDDIQRGRGSLSPQDALKIFDELSELNLKNSSLFDEKFYGEVNKYYGTNFDVKKTKAELKKGTFRVVKSERNMSWGNSDPTRLQNYIINFNSNIDPEKVRAIDHIGQLAYIAQTLAQTNSLPDEYEFLKKE